MYSKPEQATQQTISVVCMETIEKLKTKPGGDYSQKISVYNFTTMPISLVNRLGIISVVKPQRMEGGRKQGPGIMVTVEMSGSRSHVSLDSTCKLNGVNDKIYEELHLNYKPGTMNSSDITNVSFWLSETDLQEKGGVVYLPQVDMQISSLEDIKIPPHPHTEEGRGFHNALDNEFFRSTKHSALAIELIDNENTFVRNVYINILQHVYMLIPKRDTTRTSGVYVTTNGCCNRYGAKDSIQIKHYSLSDVNDKLGVLYQNYEEAVVLATDEQLQARQRQDASDLAVQQDHDLKLAKIEFERESLEHKRIMERESRLLAAEKTELDRAKQTYVDMMSKVNEKRDDEMHRRKVLMEYIRMIPIVLTVGLAIWAKFKK